MQRLKHTLGAGYIPKQFIEGKAIFRIGPLLLEFGGKLAKRRPPVLRGIEYGNAELAPSHSAWEPNERTFCRVRFPGIDLAVDLSHPRQNAKETA